MPAASSRQQSGFGKYRGLSISIVLLVILIVSLLSLNLFLSDSIKKSGQTTSVVGRQSALINQISKDLFLIDSRFQSNLPINEETAALKQAIDTFEGTLNAFTYGGAVPAVDGSSEEVVLSKFSGNNAEIVLFESQTMWSWYKDSVAPIFISSSFEESQLLNARDISEKYTKRLAFLMDLVSNGVQAEAEETLSRLQIAQYVGITLTVFMLIWTIFVTVRNLRKNDQELDRARQETTDILSTVREGLFLLDENIDVSSQYSNEMESIFETTDVGGRAFTDLLSGIISHDDMETVEEFVKLLFDEEKIESLIETLNPLDQVEASFFDDDTGTTKTKHLSFVFYRVMSAGKIVDILVSVRDISEQVLLEQQLDDAKKQSDQQIEMLVSFLHADPTTLKRFLMDSRKSLGDINDILKEPVSDKNDFQDKVDKMFIQIHRMKGEAGAMKFEEFADRAHEFESDLSRLRRVKNIEGIDFLPLVIKLDKLISYTDNLYGLHNRMGGNYANPASSGDAAPKTSISYLAKAWEHLPSLVEQISSETGKKVDFVMTGLVESDLDTKYRGFINDISIQLLRNSIIHGIESPEERKQLSKNEMGRIDLRVSKLSDGSVELIVRDDGCGLDVEKIRRKIIDTGIAPANEAIQWPAMKVVSMVFKPGFSTADSTSMHAGRGVGLDVIKDSVKKFGGKLRVNQAANKYCQFEIVLPPMEGDTATAA